MGDPGAGRQDRGTAAGYFLGCLTPASANITFRVHNAAATPYDATYAETATSGWVHYVGVYIGSNVLLYRNGVQVASAVADGTLLESPGALVVGVGFQGLIDELTIWRQDLQAGDVTTLYNSGAGILQSWPDTQQDSSDTPGVPGAPSGYLSEPYAEVYGGGVGIVIPDIVMALAPFAPDCQEGVEQIESMLSSPYVIVANPRRIFIDPHPAILDISVDSNHIITATANAGPTDATSLATWWAITIESGVVVVVADLESGQIYQTNHDHTDTWDVPLGQNWNGKQVRFWMQAVDDASQQWASAPFVLNDPNFNNSPGNAPQPLPPGPPLPPGRGPTRGLPGPGVVHRRTLDFSKPR